MYYTIYEVKNQINGKIYIGAHKSKKLKDSYMGSSRLLHDSIKKYGIQNFSKKILFVYDNEKDMYEKEKEIVNEDFVNREDTYNLKVGGFGGWSLINNSDQEHIERCRKGGKISYEKNLKNCQNVVKFKANDDRTKLLSIKGNAHRKLFGLTPEWKEKIRISALKREQKKRERKAAGNIPV